MHPYVTKPNRDPGRSARARLVAGVGLFVLAFLIAYACLALLRVGR